MTSTLTQLTLYPVKSCGGLDLREAVLTEAGLMSNGICDREWMVVDADGDFLTQREFPQMATIKPHFLSGTLTLHAPGMAPLEVTYGPAKSTVNVTANVRLWDDAVKATDCGQAAAIWFSTILGVVCRLVRFHPEMRRLASIAWTEGIEVPTRFSDGFPILVISQASLDDLNERLSAQGRNALPMNRFRPNIVIDGVGPFEEDFADVLIVGAARMKPVKPCPRCPIPSIDQELGIIGPDPLDILQAYRTNPKVGGAITFGMNAIVLEGDGQLLHIGQSCEIELAF